MNRKPEVTTRVAKLERLNNSVNGNPRYRVVFNNGSSAITSSDAGFCYAIDNPEMRGRVNVWFTKAGRIEHMEPAAKNSVDQVLAVLDDPRNIGESAYRAMYEDVADALHSAEDDANTDMVGLALAELENFVDWARTCHDKLAIQFNRQPLTS